MKVAKELRTLKKAHLLKETKKQQAKSVLKLETFLRRQIYLSYLCRLHSNPYTNKEEVERLAYDEIGMNMNDIYRNTYVIKIRHPETYINHLLQNQRTKKQIEKIFKDQYDEIFLKSVSMLKTRTKKEARFEDMYIVERKGVNYLFFNMKKWKDNIEIMTGETLTNP